MDADMQQIHVHSISELHGAARQILDFYPDARIFALQGNLGSGKTTLIKAFCELLNVTDIVTSPSFSIINEYHSVPGDLVYHFDFYRIRKIEEVMDIGYEEYIYSDSFCFMEWPEKISELLPPDFVYISITAKQQDDSRVITFQRVSSLPD
jgi:tRNA threonylcarbamoyladenosine biosynthesis protein TsaE